jgi:class 3 adenylate cyclase/tetratricopeptide (TPR) repeat protein
MAVMPGECVACGHLNRTGARFCAECGAAVGVRCASCGAELADGARFCDTCGAPVAPADAIETVEGARKTVSVVFSDLAGSTAMQEALDPESVRRVMARYYEVMRATVERHGGAVEKFIGDAVLAVFGTPIVREDDALRAVRCAAEMVSELGRLNDELERAWGVRLQMRTGVNTGELVISREGIMVGDTMNTAARLEQAAPPGEVLIGESTWRLVRHRISVVELAPLELKGKAAPTRTWRVAAGVPDPDGQTHRQPAEAPLVGRAEELGRLAAALQQASDDRVCRLVSIVGSPGLGKSRLAAEFATHAQDGALIVHGHCEPSGEGNTFLPVAEVVREVAGIGEADPADVVRDKLRAMNPDDPDRDRLVEAVAGVLGIARPASAQETFWALRRGLEVLARERPLVLVLDDLHWAQPMLLDLVEHLVEWITDVPVLLVALARPELREVREALTIPGRRASDVIELEPLDSGESVALVDGILGEAELPDDLLARILETTEGNPLFLGELVRMLIDEGALVRSEDGWQVAGGTASVDVPPTIQALLAARIERLRADERAVVERAAVIGKQFYRGAVMELLAPPARPAIDGHLEALRRKEMVEPEGIYWIDEPVYRFHHVLIRDAAYRQLLKEARTVLHERFADWLEAKAGALVGEYEEVIAFHLEQSHAYLGELGPLDEAGHALGERAAAHLLAAGRRALAREDLAAAENLLSRALECGRAKHAEVLWDLADALLSAGDVSNAASVVDRYVTAAGDDEVGSARSAVLSAQLANLTGDDDPAQTAESVREAATELAARGDGAGEGKAWQVAAQTYARLGRVGEVETALDRALTAARQAGDTRRTTAVLAAAPRAALWGPSSVVRSSGRCLDVVRILRMTPGNRHVEALALRCQAVLEAMRGRFDAAREILASARATLEELGLTLELHETQVYAGMVELLADEPSGDHRAHDRLGGLQRARGGCRSRARGGTARASACRARRRRRPCARAGSCRVRPRARRRGPSHNARSSHCSG